MKAGMGKAFSWLTLPRTAALFVLAALLATLGVGLWWMTVAACEISGVFILWLIVLGVVGGQVLAGVLALTPFVRSWVARRKSVGDRLTFWLFAQAVLGVLVAMLVIHVALPSSVAPPDPQALLAQGADPAATRLNESRWSRLVEEQSRKTWVFSVHVPEGVVRPAHSNPALDASVNAWSMAWPGGSFVGATPALLALPDASVRAAIAHELGHIAIASGDTLNGQVRPDPHSVLADLACMVALTVVLLFAWSPLRRFIAVLFFANLVAWLTLVDVGRWVDADRQNELAADGYAAVWASGADMARVLVAAADACRAPPAPLGHFADHPALALRLAALGTDVPTVCQGLLLPQPPSF